MNYKSILIAGVAGTIMFAAARAMPIDATVVLLQPAPTSQNPIQRQHEDLTRYLLETAPH